MKPTGFVTYSTLIAKRDGYSPTAMRFQAQLVRGTGRVILDGGSSLDQVMFSSGPAASSWTHVAVVATPSESALYLDGIKLDVRGPITLGTASAANVALGSNGENPAGTADAVDGFDGDLDDVRVYDRALAANEIEQLHNM